MILIEHLFIKNYKAFKKESIVLGDHTLFIGTHLSGKTTILEALDLFFNHQLDYRYIRNKTQAIVIECLIDEKRYRKVFSPPHFTMNGHKCIGNFNEIHHIKYLYLPKKPHTIEHFFNQCIALNKSIHDDDFDQRMIYNANLFFNKISQVRTHPTVEYTLRLKAPLSLQTQKKVRAEQLKLTPVESLILGVDHCENSFNTDDVLPLVGQSYQSLLISKQKQWINTFPYTVMPLYKHAVKDEMGIYTTPMHKRYKKTMILVEGKYDVPWFETALKLLRLSERFRVIPCGGYGNIQFVKQQFEKEGIETIVIADGDAMVSGHKLKRDIIELYADYRYINEKFNTDFHTTPPHKYALFNRIKEKDDVVKKVLSSWAKNYLTEDAAFVQEIKPWLMKA